MNIIYYRERGKIMTLEQEKTIEMIKNVAKSYNYILGVILIGSLAKNTGNKESDVDIIVVVDDDEFMKRKLIKNYFCGTIFDQPNYPTYIDGKIVNKEYLRKIWSEGNECVKNTFSEVKLIYLRDPEISKLLNDFDKINYNKNENIKKFYALMTSYSLKAKDDVNNIIQIKHGIFNTVFFACRLILAHNDVYYPYVKNMEKAIKNCEKKPDNFLENMYKVLETFSFNDLDLFYETTEEYFKEYKFDDSLRKGYVIENEEYWFFNVRPYSEI
jgi:predicted nucleotidyltransferase